MQQNYIEWRSLKTIPSISRHLIVINFSYLVLASVRVQIGFFFILISIARSEHQSIILQIQVHVMLLCRLYGFVIRFTVYFHRCLYFVKISIKNSIFFILLRFILNFNQHRWRGSVIMSHPAASKLNESVSEFLTILLKFS